MDIETEAPEIYNGLIEFWNISKPTNQLVIDKVLMQLSQLDYNYALDAFNMLDDKNKPTNIASALGRFREFYNRVRDADEAVKAKERLRLESKAREILTYSNNNPDIIRLNTSYGRPSNSAGNCYRIYGYLVRNKLIDNPDRGIKLFQSPAGFKKILPILTKELENKESIILTQLQHTILTLHPEMTP